MFHITRKRLPAKNAESLVLSQSGWRDLNSRPLAPQTNTLTMLSYIPEVGVGLGVSVCVVGECGYGCVCEGQR